MTSSRLTEVISRFTRQHPVLMVRLKKMLPISVKRSLGKVLMPPVSEGTIAAKDGREFVMIPDRVFLMLIYEGVFEATLTSFIGKTIRKGDICVDVGANFGWFATLMAKDAKTVIAYEPAKRIRNIMSENIALNGMSEIVDVRGVAVGREPGTAVLVIEGDPEIESALGYVSDQKNVSDGEEIDIVRLDEDLASLRGQIAIIKLDAEGFETYAIEGAKALLTDPDPPIFITEANRGTLARAGSSREELCRLLKSHGYTLFGMNEGGTIYPDNGKAPALACIPDRGKFKNRYPTT